MSGDTSAVRNLMTVRGEWMIADAKRLAMLGKRAGLRRKLVLSCCASVSAIWINGPASLRSNGYADCANAFVSCSSSGAACSIVVAT